MKHRLPWLLLLLCQIIAPAAEAGDDIAVATSGWSDSSLTIVFVGDIMLGRGVKRITDTAGLHYPFLPTYSLLRSADLAIGNLESPLTTADYKTTSPWKFKGDTSAAAFTLRRAGFGLLALANNHAPDCGDDGFYDTQRFLEQAGIKWSGRGDSFRLKIPQPDFEADIPYPYCLPSFIEVKGFRLGFLSFCQPYLLEISKDYGGNLIARADSATVVNSIRLIRDRCHLVVCSFHWGQEYQDRPNAEQKNLARLAIRCGADIVHGHHPHVLQGVEFYRGGLIAYSLGNFIFDQRQAKPRQSGLLFVKLIKTTSDSNKLTVDSVSFVPLEIVKNRPQPADAQSGEILGRMADLCRHLGSGARIRDRVLHLYPVKEGPPKAKKPD